MGKQGPHSLVGGEGLPPSRAIWTHLPTLKMHLPDSCGLANFNSRDTTHSQTQAFTGALFATAKARDGLATHH